MAAREVEAEAAARARKAEERAKRREQVQEETFLLSQQLKLRALEILRWPLTEERTTTSADGKTIIKTISPAGWRLRDAALFIKLADDLARISVGLPVRIAVTHQAEGGPAAAQEAQAEVPARLVAAWRELAAADALAALGLDDAQPDDDEDEHY
jgi:hypothetical protein